MHLVLGGTSRGSGPPAISILVTCRAGVHHTSLGEFVLKLQHRQPRFCGFG